MGLPPGMVAVSSQQGGPLRRIPDLGWGWSWGPNDVWWAIPFQHQCPSAACSSGCMGPCQHPHTCWCCFSLCCWGLLSWSCLFCNGNGGNAWPTLLSRCHMVHTAHSIPCLPMPWPASDPPHCCHHEMQISHPEHIRGLHLQHATSTTPSNACQEKRLAMAKAFFCERRRGRNTFSGPALASWP